MKRLAWIICPLWCISSLTQGYAHVSSIDVTGAMPGVLVTATRYEHEDAAWSGLMDEVVVTAKGPGNDDLALDGLMDTIVVSASRTKGADIVGAGVLTTMKKNISLLSGMNEEDMAKSLTRLIYAYTALFIAAVGAFIWCVVVYYQSH